MASLPERPDHKLLRWEDNGCEECRALWMRPLATEPRVLGVSDEEMATIYRCGCCGAYWASGYQYPHEIPPSRARALFPNLEELERKARLY